MIFFCEKKTKNKKNSEYSGQQMVSLCLETILDGEKQSRINYEPKWPIDMNGKKHCDFNANLENEEKKRNLKIWNENLSTKLIDQNGHHHRNKRRKKEKIKVIAIRINGSWQARILDFFFLLDHMEHNGKKKHLYVNFNDEKKVNNNNNSLHVYPMMMMMSI